IGLKGGKHIDEPCLDLDQPFGKAQTIIGRDGAIGDMSEPRAVDVDDAPARCTQTRINAEKSKRGRRGVGLFVQVRNPEMSETQALRRPTSSPSSNRTARSSNKLAAHHRRRPALRAI